MAAIDPRRAANFKSRRALYLADVIAVPGDVLQNPAAVENVLLVVKGGRVIRQP